MKNAGAEKIYSYVTSGAKSGQPELERMREQIQPGFVEEFKVMLLNRGNRVLVIVQISRGGIAGNG